MTRTTHHHPFRGVIGGLLLGLGLGLATIIYGIAPIGSLTPYAAFLVGLAIGILLIFLPSLRKGRPNPPRALPSPVTPLPRRQAEPAAARAAAASRSPRCSPATTPRSAGCTGLPMTARPLRAAATRVMSPERAPARCLP